MEFGVIIFVWACIGGFIGMIVGELGDKHNGHTGLFLGALLGPVGWIIVAVLPPGEDPDGPAPAKTAAKTETELKIAIMEAQLAQLKREAKNPITPGSKPAARMGYDNDGQIPTYKLD